MAEPKMPHIEAKLITAPRATFRPGKAALLMRRTAVRLTSSTRLKPSISHSRLWSITPAALTRASTRSKRLKKPLTSASLVTSST
ncbi:hypothetical protein D3C73_1548580 [compost metagenome]